MNRAIIAHGHIFKNAGTTLDWSLARNLGDAFVDHRDDVPMRRQGAAYLGPYLEERPWIRALSSHHLCYPLPDLEDARFHLVYLLRHPLERVLSVYNFERLQDATTPGAINAKRLDLPEYVAWRMQPDAGPTIRDFQTRYLAGRLLRSKHPMTAADLETALQTLHEHASVGIVERYDESMVAFETRLRPNFPGLDLAYVAQNVGAEPERDQAAKLDELAVRLGPAGYDRLVANNRNDLELYEAAHRELDERLDAIGGLGAALDNLGRRNAALAAGGMA